jgi:hypothetical protein
MRRLLFSGLFLVPSLALAQAPAQDIVVIRDNFIIANIAAKKCNAADSSKEAVYERNFTMIARRAMEQVMARSPGMPQEEVRKQDLDHIARLQDATFNLVRAEGCKSDRVRALLRMHKMHEDVRF